VLVVGSANADLVARVERFPAPGETVIGTDFKVHPGGKGANQAVAAARFGARTFFAGALGEDANATMLRTSLNDSGVDVSYLRGDMPIASGVALILVDQTGQNQITVVPGANAAIDANQIPIADLAEGGTQVLLVQLEIPISVVNDCLWRAKRSGMTTMLNPAPSTGYVDILWPEVDVLIPNEHEATELGDLHVRSGFRGVTVVSRGKLGVDLRLRGHPPVKIEAPKVHAVDATAAGDCFCGVLAALWHHASDKIEACRYAAMAASLSVTRQGAQPSMPTRDEVDRFIASL